MALGPDYINAITSKLEHNTTRQAATSSRKPSDTKSSSPMVHLPLAMLRPNLLKFRNRLLLRFGCIRTRRGEGAGSRRRVFHFTTRSPCPFSSRSMARAKSWVSSTSSATTLAREAMRRYLNGEHTISLADQVATEKIVDLSASRARLRRLPDDRTKQEVGNLILRGCRRHLPPCQPGSGSARTPSPNSNPALRRSL
jgi:hypothetical protein